jgi:hypothetical protein
MKKLFFAFIIFFPATHSYAEAIFMKSGVIIEGQIVRNSKEMLAVKEVNGQRHEISRNEILRIINNTHYKDKRTLVKKDGTKLRVYIVSETKDEYICRKKLRFADEIIISKKDVDSITAQRTPFVINFRDNMDGTMTDLRSGYVWPKNMNIAEKPIWFEEARRMIKEYETLLKDIVDEDDLMTALEDAGFKNVQATYWTNREVSANRSIAVAYSFYYKKEYETSFSTDNVFFMPVIAKSAKRNKMQESTITEEIDKYLNELSPVERKKYIDELRKKISDLEDSNKNMMKQNNK